LVQQNFFEDGKIVPVNIREQMKQCYIDYAMSVIIGRALPDVRDGLKPVHRRILFAMNELGMTPDKPFKKCARIVGEVLGKYHPHGDSSVYEALVRMAQDFNTRYLMVDGHGNFGSVDGDGAAAMRYTEARMHKITTSMLADIDCETVDFVPNFDGSLEEPSVLPVRLPMLLLNGVSGIAVGMATNIPPHNLCEIVDGTIALIDNPNMTPDDLLKYVKGPDFPTGASIIGLSEIRKAYTTGRGSIKMSAISSFEEITAAGRQAKTAIVVTEIPYQVNKAVLISKIAELVRDKKIDGISDIRDESDRDGMRIVIELKRDAKPDVVRNNLYKYTQLTASFGVNMLAIDNGRPETMSLKEIMRACADFQFEVATRKYTTLLKKEQEKKEIQEGLIKACNVIDLVIEILRGSKDRSMAKNCLVNGETEGINFKSRESKAMASQLMFTEAQADAILEMRLYKLIGLELDALIKEHEETVANIFKYEDILESHESMSLVIQNDLNKIEKEYQTPRKTIIDNRETAVYEEKPVEETDVAFIMDRFGYAKTIDANTYEKNKETIQAEFKFSFIMKNTGKVCFFTNAGNLHTVKAMDLPQGKMRDKGIPIDNVSNFDTSKETVVLAASQSELNLYRLVFTTKQAMMKIVDGGEFDVSKRTVAATKLMDGDEVVNVEVIHTQKTVILRSNDGYFLRFYVETIPEKKKAAVGVRGMRLGKNDYIRDVYYLNDMEEKMIEHNDKELQLGHLKVTSRDTKGTKVRL